MVVGETTRIAIAIIKIDIAWEKNERDVGGEGGDSTEDMDPAEDVGAGLGVGRPHVVGVGGGVHQVDHRGLAAGWGHSSPGHSCAAGCSRLDTV